MVPTHNGILFAAKSMKLEIFIVNEIKTNTMRYESLKIICMYKSGGLYMCIYICLPVFYLNIYIYIF